MAATATKQLNNYKSLPQDLLLSDFSLGSVLVLSDVYSFTGEKKSCHRTYKTFGNRSGVSRATVGRALRKGKSEELISIDKEKGYVFDCTKIKGDRFYRLHDWVVNEEFNVRKNERRRLLLSEATIYAYIYTHCTNKNKSAKTCEKSISEIAADTGLSERTVQRRRWSLIRAGLIYCPNEDKGVNAYKKSTYTLNYKLVRQHEKKADGKPAAKAKTPNTAEEIEQAYRDKRERAELVAERNVIRARENVRFKYADDLYNSLRVSVSLANVLNPEKVAELERRVAQAKTERLLALSALGFSEEDLEPRYECKLCNDKGWLPNGERCKCYPRGAPQDDGENVGVDEQNK